MAVIATLIEPNRVTRVFFDCQQAANRPGDEQRIARAIAASVALGSTEEAMPGVLPTAA